MKKTLKLSALNLCEQLFSKLLILLHSCKNLIVF